MVVVVLNATKRCAKRNGTFARPRKYCRHRCCRRPNFVWIDCSFSDQTRPKSNPVVHHHRPLVVVAYCAQRNPVCVCAPMWEWFRRSNRRRSNYRAYSCPRCPRTPNARAYFDLRIRTYPFLPPIVVPRPAVLVPDAPVRVVHVRCAVVPLLVFRVPIVLPTVSSSCRLEFEKVTTFDTMDIGIPPPSCVVPIPASSTETFEPERVGPPWHEWSFLPFDVVVVDGWIWCWWMMMM
mmetsp:Transcript_735/g.1456  ORF Transcript_735/g.1456 Transcript_735/m.1456 type:complete len:235 (-) Transcript_735:232-936(-)